MAEGEGLHDIVTFREQTSSILRDYFKMPNKNDEEAQKRAIIETAAKLIKSDIKTHLMPIMIEYPKATDLGLECTLEYVPLTLDTCSSMFPQRLKSYGARVTYALGDLVGKGEPAQGSSNGSKS